MTDARAGWNHAEVFKGGLTPTQELVTLLVALEFDFRVLVCEVFVAEEINHDRVVDHEINRRDRIDLLWISAEFHNGFAHGGEVYDRRNAGEVLQQNACWAVSDLRRAALVVHPAGKSLDVVRGDGLAVFKTQQVFEQHFQGERQLGKVAELLVCLWQRVVVEFLTGSGQGGPNIHGILAWNHVEPPFWRWSRCDVVMSQKRGSSVATRKNLGGL